MNYSSTHFETNDKQTPSVFLAHEHAIVFAKSDDDDDDDDDDSNVLLYHLSAPEVRRVISYSRSSQLTYVRETLYGNPTVQTSTRSL
jgi:hypothetical protein